MPLLVINQKRKVQVECWFNFVSFTCDRSNSPFQTSIASVGLASLACLACLGLVLWREI